jgi:hypothetical protein
VRVTAGGRRAWLVVGAIVAVAAVVALALVVTGGDEDDVGTASGEVRLEPIDAVFVTDLVSGLDLRPLGAGLAIALPDVPPLGSGLSDALAGITASGDEPGLYGGSRQIGTCDVDQLVDFLTDPANRALAGAWASVHGIDVDEIAGFIAELTPVRLRFDTRVTNHGFADGRATPIQSVLEAGTAVLVDERGVPRAKCACGNPLVPPDTAVVAPVENPAAWEGYDPAEIVTVEAGEAVDAYVLVDVDDGVLYERPVGTDGEADEPLAPGGQLCDVFTESPTCTGGEFAPDLVVPDVAGSDVAAARRALQDLGFIGEVEERSEPSGAPAGVVVGTEPPAGREVPAKSPIVLIVSSGPEETSTTAAATTSTTSPRVSTSTSTSSTSTSTSTSSTTTTAPHVTVPNVVGEVEQAAVSILADVGLEAERTTAFAPNEQPGTVVAQDPQPGASVPPGSTVVIVVAEGPPID